MEILLRLHNVLPTVLPLNAAIDILQYSTAEALFRIADSLYATISPVFNSLIVQTSQVINILNLQRNVF